MALQLYNSLTKKKEIFVPISKDKKVGVYTCGPTVYSYVQIGNWRTYVLSDLVVRTLQYLGYKPDYIMNITDVGHLTGDNLGDADLGDDRVEEASIREGKTAWQIAEMYTNDFIEGVVEMNLVDPRMFTRATAHIKQQIDLVKKIIDKGFSYQTTDGIYFDVSAYERAGNNYGQLSSLDKIKEGARVAKNDQKKDPRDFALWKFSQPFSNDAVNNPFPKRQMNWFFDGPLSGELVTGKNLLQLKEDTGLENDWLATVGFPGWHIECSAMSMEYLGEQFDIHLGGEDLISTHHPNEIAQSESATGKKPFVKYWLHGRFLLVDGRRMGKSRGNAYTLHDLNKRGFNGLDLRYFYLTAHYRKQLNFTWKALAAAQTARINLVKAFNSFKSGSGKGNQKAVNQYKKDFRKQLEDDFNLPKALAVVWRVIKDRQLAEGRKKTLLLDFDKVLGLKLDQLVFRSVPKEILKLLEQRNKLRNKKMWQQADKIREKIENKGFVVKDLNGESRVEFKG